MTAMTPRPRLVRAADQSLVRTGGKERTRVPVIMPDQRGTRNAQFAIRNIANTVVSENRIALRRANGSTASSVNVGMRYQGSHTGKTNSTKARHASAAI